jgi:hypothetical protein
MENEKNCDLACENSWKALQEELEEENYEFERTQKEAAVA